MNSLPVCSQLCQSHGPINISEFAWQAPFDNVWQPNGTILTDVHHTFYFVEYKAMI